MKLFIATPCYGGKLYSGYLKSIIKLIDLLKDFKINYKVKIIDNDSLITRARNRLVYHFLNSDCTHLIFIDSDITFLPKSIIYMINSNKNVIGGCYPKKQINIEKMIKQKNDQKDENMIFATSNDYVLSGLQNTKDDMREVDYIGTGFLMIKKEVFINLEVDSYYCDICKDKVYEYFKTGIYKNTYLSEDYFFCKMLKDKGYKIFTNIKIPLNHTGQITYPGCLKLNLDN